MLPFEMGGYLPLELPRGQAYFSDIAPEHILAVNTGRTALWCAVNSLKVKTVYAPCYYCPSVLQTLGSMGVRLKYYHIGPDLMPLELDVTESDAAVILVNYFGVMRRRITEYAARFARVILDQAHDFYAPPILRKGAMNIYSCRKFFGVSDGAYVIGAELQKPDLPRDVSYSHAVHLIKSIEVGSNGAYQENKANEQELGNAYLTMSRLTERIMQSVDYEAVAERRRKNFRRLHEGFRGLQQLDGLEADCVPYTYPLLLDRDIHAALVQKRIYVPILWEQLMEKEWTGTLEQRYAACLLPLPLDQRYQEEQLEQLIQIVRQETENRSIS